MLHPALRLVIIIALATVLLWATGAFAQPLPDTLLMEAKYISKSTCVWRNTQHDCHVVEWKGEKYLVMTKDRQPKYVAKTIKGKVVEVWRHTDIEV